MPLPLLALLLTGCDAPPTLHEPAAEYARSVRPLMEESAALEHRFLDLSGTLIQGNLEPDAIEVVLESELIPTAEALQSKAVQAAPQAPELAVVHAALEKAWQDRATAWRDALEAWQHEDAAALEQAMAARARSRQTEERYLLDVNAILRPYGTSISRYP